MGRKRYAALFLAALMVLALTACGADKDKDKEKEGGMTIAPAQLTEEESALVNLLGVDLGTYRIFDFQVEGAKSFQIDSYELVGNDWNPVNIGQSTFEPEGTGRIALRFGKMTEGVLIRYQGADGHGGSGFSMLAQPDETGLTFATSALDGPAAVELDAEIPLVLQVASSKGEFSTYGVGYFGMPRELAKNGYEHVYAITVMFSQKPISQLSQDAPSAEPAPET